MKTTIEINEQLKSMNPLKAKHSEDVLVIVMKLLPELGLSESVQKIAMQAADLHNTGWILLPELAGITRKYTDEEFAKMRQYPKLGAAKLKLEGFSDEVCDAVALHADNLSEEQPMAARIVRFARDFRNCLQKYSTVEEAIADVRSCAGKVYDEKIVEAAAKVYLA